MAWVIGIICAGIALVMFFRYPLQTVVAVLVIGAGVWFFVDRNAKDTQRRHELERSLVAASEIDFSDLQLVHSYGAAWNLTGNATNRSSHTVTGIEMHLKLENCPAELACVTIGEADTTVSVTIPAGQMRAIKGLANFPNLPALDGWKWSYTVDSVTAR